MLLAVLWAFVLATVVTKSRSYAMVDDSNRDRMRQA
jgi:hypothetical protein